jgi:hypothetical protein
LGTVSNRHDLQRENVPRLTRLLALAHRWRRLVDNGTVASFADIARLLDLSRARVTQIMQLLYLAPNIQEEILLGGSDVRERTTRPITRTPEWQEQQHLWRKLTAQRTTLNVSVNHRATACSIGFADSNRNLTALGRESRSPNTPLNAQNLRPSDDLLGVLHDGRRKAGPVYPALLLFGIGIPAHGMDHHRELASLFAELTAFCQPFAGFCYRFAAFCRYSALEVIPVKPPAIAQ